MVGDTNVSEGFGRELSRDIRAALLCVVKVGWSGLPATKVLGSEGLRGRRLGTTCRDL